MSSNAPPSNNNHDSSPKMNNSSNRPGPGGVNEGKGQEGQARQRHPLNPTGIARAKSSAMKPSAAAPPQVSHASRGMMPGGNPKEIAGKGREKDRKKQREEKEKQRPISTLQQRESKVYHDKYEGGKDKDQTFRHPSHHLQQQHPPVSPIQQIQKQQHHKPQSAGEAAAFFKQHHHHQQQHSIGNSNAPPVGYENYKAARLEQMQQYHLQHQQREKERRMTYQQRHDHLQHLQQQYPQYKATSPSSSKNSLGSNGHSRSFISAGEAARRAKMTATSVPNPLSSASHEGQSNPLQASSSMNRSKPSNNNSVGSHQVSPSSNERQSIANHHRPHPPSYPHPLTQTGPYTAATLTANSTSGKRRKNTSRYFGGSDELSSPHILPHPPLSQKERPQEKMNAVSSITTSPYFGATPTAQQPDVVLSPSSPRATSNTSQKKISKQQGQNQQQPFIFPSIIAPRSTAQQQHSLPYNVTAQQQSYSTSSEANENPQSFDPRRNSLPIQVKRQQQQLPTVSNNNNSHTGAIRAGNYAMMSSPTSTSSTSHYHPHPPNNDNTQGTASNPIQQCLASTEHGASISPNSAKYKHSHQDRHYEHHRGSNNKMENFKNERQNQEKYESIPSPSSQNTNNRNGERMYNLFYKNSNSSSSHNSPISSFQPPSHPFNKSKGQNKRQFVEREPDEDEKVRMFLSGAYLGLNHHNKKRRQEYLRYHQEEKNGYEDRRRQDFSPSPSSIGRKTGNGVSNAVAPQQMLPPPLLPNQGSYKVRHSDNHRHQRNLLPPPPPPPPLHQLSPAYQNQMENPSPSTYSAAPPPPAFASGEKERIAEVGMDDEEEGKYDDAATDSSAATDTNNIPTLMERQQPSSVSTQNSNPVGRHTIDRKRRKKENHHPSSASSQQNTSRVPPNVSESPSTTPATTPPPPPPARPYIQKSIKKGLLIPTTLEEIVKRASTIIAAEIRSGSWSCVDNTPDLTSDEEEKDRKEEGKKDIMEIESVDSVLIDENDEKRKRYKKLNKQGDEEKDYEKRHDEEDISQKELSMLAHHQMKKIISEEENQGKEKHQEVEEIEKKQDDEKIEVDAVEKMNGDDADAKNKVLDEARANEREASKPTKETSASGMEGVVALAEKIAPKELLKQPHVSIRKPTAEAKKDAVEQLPTDNNSKQNATIITKTTRVVRDDANVVQAQQQKEKAAKLAEISKSSLANDGESSPAFASVRPSTTATTGDFATKKDEELAIEVSANLAPKINREKLIQESVISEDIMKALYGTPSLFNAATIPPSHPSVGPDSIGGNGKSIMVSTEKDTTIGTTRTGGSPMEMTATTRINSSPTSADGTKCDNAVFEQKKKNHEENQFEREKQSVVQQLRQDKNIENEERKGVIVNETKKDFISSAITVKEDVETTALLEKEEAKITDDFKTCLDANKKKEENSCAVTSSFDKIVAATPRDKTSLDQRAETMENHDVTQDSPKIATCKTSNMDQRKEQVSSRVTTVEKNAEENKNQTNEKKTSSTSNNSAKRQRRWYCSNRDNEATRHCAAVAIENFAMEVVLPSLLASGVQEDGCGREVDNKRRGDNNEVGEKNEKEKDNRRHRAFVATLLALREVMTMNADSIFFHGENNNHDDDNDDETGKHRNISHKKRKCNIDDDTNEIPGERRRLKQYKKEEKIFRSQNVATGVVLKALNRLQSDVRHDISNEFIRAARLYDTADDEFASCLERADGRCSVVLPNGAALGREENVAWRVSYNRARGCHPLMRGKRRREVLSRLHHRRAIVSNGDRLAQRRHDRRLRQHEQELFGETEEDDIVPPVDSFNVPQYRTEIPKANVCAMYIVERLPFKQIEAREMKDNNERQIEQERRLYRDHREKILSSRSKRRRAARQKHQASAAAAAAADSAVIQQHQSPHDVGHGRHSNFISSPNGIAMAKLPNTGQNGSVISQDFHHGSVVNGGVGVGFFSPAVTLSQHHQHQQQGGGGGDGSLLQRDESTLSDFSV